MNRIGYNPAQYENSFAQHFGVGCKTVNKELQSKPESGTESAGEQITQNTTEQKLQQSKGLNKNQSKDLRQNKNLRLFPNQSRHPIHEPKTKTVKIILGRLQNIIEKMI